MIVPFEYKDLLRVAKEDQELARMLGDHQNSDFTLKPSQTHRLVNALLNSGNMIETIAKAQQESDSVASA